MKYLEARRLRREPHAGRDEAKMRRRYYEDKALPGPVYEPEPEVEAVDTVTETEWPLRMKPNTYLALHPTGQWAELARRIVGEDDAEPS
jgi:hypothetical protein